MSNLVRLNLGCGRHSFPKEEGWTNVDISPTDNVDVIANLEFNWPWPENYADELFCAHTLEHIEDSLYFMGEAWRVAKPGAKMMILVPYGSSDDADEDPTHVKRYFLNSFYYFSQLAYYNADYGYKGDWDTSLITLDLDANLFKGLETEEVLRDIRTQRNMVKQMKAELVAIKPARQPSPTPMELKVALNFA
jgi:hypothetical protein